MWDNMLINCSLLYLVIHLDGLENLDKAKRTLVYFFVPRGREATSRAELITKRPAAKNEGTVLITARLANYNIVVDAISITNFSFSSVFTQAIESKVTAVQDAERAENQLQTIKIQAEQAVAQANGTAHSIQLIQDQLQKSPDYIKCLLATKWNGILPQVTGTGGFPLLNIQNVTR